MDPLDSAEYVLTTTRSVRKRLDLGKPVSRDVVEQCLDMAFQAPNGSNLNTWKWVLVDDPEKIARIGELYRQSMEDHIATLGDATGASYAGADIPNFDGISDSVAHLCEHMGEVPVIAFPLMAGRAEKATRLFDQAGMWGSILQSVWSFFLALRTKGMASAWTTVHLYREQEFAELLGIPYKKYTQVGLFPVAYTIGTDFKKAWRKPVQEVVSWNQFEH